MINKNSSKQPANKGDVNIVKKSIENFRQDCFKIFSTKQDLIELEERIDEKMKRQFDNVLIKQDKMIKILEDRDIENAADKIAHRRYDDKLENHEVKIKVLENQTV